MKTVVSLSLMCLCLCFPWEASAQYHPSSSPRWWPSRTEPRIVQQTGVLEIRSPRAAVITINEGRGYDIRAGQTLRWDHMPVGVHTLRAIPFVDGQLAPDRSWQKTIEVFERQLTAIEIDWVPQADQTLRVELSPGVHLDMVWIPPGDFWMGSPEHEEARVRDEVRHRVVFTNGFWMGIYEVTQEQWQALMGNNPSRNKGPRRPVEMVSWLDAMDFVAALNALTRDGGFRLPTEAEWEYACRAGTTTPFNTGHTIESIQANFDAVQPYGENPDGVFRGRTMDVGSFAPNAWGLYDMHGNVAEWCHDWYGDYTNRVTVHPRGPRSGPGRVIRGGGYDAPAWTIRSAARYVAWPEQIDVNIGFRIVKDHVDETPSMRHRPLRR